MSSIREIEWESCLLEPRSAPEIEKRLRSEAPRVPTASRYFLPVPWAATAITVLSERFFTVAHLDHDLADRIGLVVSQDASCRYCFAATRALLLILGYSRARIAELEQGQITSEYSAGDRAAMEFARRLARANPRPTPADLEPLRRAGFAEMTIVEIVAQTTLNVLFTRLSTIPALPPEAMERLPERWYARLFAPLLRLRVRKLRRRGAPRALSADECSGPWAAAVVALDGLTIAADLRRALDAMWESTVLPRRGKALIFAVIARALGDVASERESTRLAIEAGFPPGDIESALAHLASPQFNGVEASMVPFARETIWYQAPQLQRRARAVRDQLSDEQFVELIAVVALANALCRVSTVLVPQ